MTNGIGIGIDFGTTNSVVSVYDPSIGSSRTFLSGGLPHPSVVWYRADGSTAKVGSDSKQQLRSYSGTEGHHFEASIKRHLGKDYEQSIFGRRVKAHEIAAEIFRFLKSDARSQRPDIDISNAVVTIPVYFDGRARRELRKAADEAGIYIKSFIHEPFAAIVGYFSRMSSSNEFAAAEDKTILVFDWGGGTLDITLARVIEGQLIELAIGGLNDRAGDYFDEQILQYVLKRNFDGLGANAEEVKILAGDRGRLLTECERAKIALSSSGEDKIQTSRAYFRNSRVVDIDEVIKRAELEGLVAKDLDLAISQVESTLDKGGLSPHAVDIVLLIGGTSRMPIVRNRLREIFGHRIIEIANADTIIAEGAAVIDALDFHPMLSRSICIELADESLYHVFSEGSLAVPDICRKSVNFYCTDNRDGEAKLIVKDISERLRSSKPLLMKVLSIPVSSRLPRPYNHERVSVDFWLDHDLVINVRGRAATQNEGSVCEIFDLCYGLKLHDGNRGH